MTRTRQSSLRIIGGRWRGRRLSFPAVNGLRPTPDRVRETLFNWLTPFIFGARCLDLFAGSGALGIEALSRGAAEAVFVENNANAARRLRENLLLLGVESPWVEQADALAWLARTPQPFDVIFLDPPFGTHLLEPACAILDPGWLAPKARIYLETARQYDIPALPVTWEILREKMAGQVRYCLAARHG